MKTTVNLENKDVREIIAKFLGIKVDQVIPQRYTFGIEGMSASEIERRIYGPAVRDGQNEPGGAS